MVIDAIASTLFLWAFIAATCFPRGTVIYQLTEEDRFLIGCHYEREPNTKIKAYAYMIAKKRGFEKNTKEYPTESSIRRALKKWKEDHTARDKRLAIKPKSGRKSVLTEEKLEEIETHMAANPTCNQREIASKFHISKGSVTKAFKELSLTPYHVRKRQRLNAQAIERRLVFAEHFSGKTELIKDFWITDEAHIRLGQPYFNSSHRVFYATCVEDVDEDFHNEGQCFQGGANVSIWAAVHFDRPIVYYVYPDENTRINAEKYRQMLIHHFFNKPTWNPAVDGYQQDGASVWVGLLV